MQRNSLVASPADSLNLTTLSRVKLTLGLTNSDHDLRLGRIVIPQASGRADRYCNRVFAKQLYQDRFRRNGMAHRQLPQMAGWFGRGIGLVDGVTEHIVLRQLPVRRVLSFDADGVALEEDSDFEVDPQTGIVRLLWRPGGKTPFGITRATLRYEAGYDPPSDTDNDNNQPGNLARDAADVEMAVIKLVLAYLESRNRDPMLKVDDQPGVRSQSWWTGGLRLSSGEGRGSLPVESADLLDAFILPGVG